MRFQIFASLSLLGLASCVIQTGPGGAQPATTTPAATPAPAAPAPTAAAAPTESSPKIVAAPTATATATAAPTASGVPVKAPMLRAPEINKANAFGLPKPAANTLKGEVFEIPATSKGLPNFASLQPFATIYTSAWDVAPRKFTEGFPGIGEKVEWFAIRWEGKVTAKTAGGYLFKIKSDDGARLFIDGQQIVTNDGLHPPTEAMGPTILNAGEHTAVIEYFQGPKYEIALQIWVTAPGGQPKIFTTNF